MNLLFAIQINRERLTAPVVRARVVAVSAPVDLHKVVASGQLARVVHLVETGQPLPVRVHLEQVPQLIVLAHALLTNAVLIKKLIKKKFRIK